MNSIPYKSVLSVHGSDLNPSGDTDGTDRLKISPGQIEWLESKKPEEIESFLLAEEQRYPKLPIELNLNCLKF